MGRSVRAADLRPGDCVKDSYSDELPVWVKRVRCDRPHYGEVFAVLAQPGARADACGPEFFKYAPNSPEGPVFRVARANSGQSIVCVAMSKHERWSSLRN